MKREIVNFSKKVSKGLKKSKEKFIQDIEYGISSSGSCLISNIARSLNENIKIKNTIEDIYEKEPVALFDDSDISKLYGKSLKI